MPIAGTPAGAGWYRYPATGTSLSSATLTWSPSSITGGWTTTTLAFDLTSAAGATTWDGYWYNPPRAVNYQRPDPQREAERTARREREHTARTTAIDRATRTLLELLDPTQREAYLTDRTFEVVGSAGGLYRIRPGSSGNVDWLRDGQEAGVLCAHPLLWNGRGHLPGPDVALAQMLALTTDEADFVRTANVHRGQRPTHLIAA